MTGAGATFDDAPIPMCCRLNDRAHCRAIQALLLLSGSLRIRIGRVQAMPATMVGASGRVASAVGAVSCSYPVSCITGAEGVGVPSLDRPDLARPSQVPIRPMARLRSPIGCSNRSSHGETRTYGRVRRRGAHSDAPRRTRGRAQRSTQRAARGTTLGRGAPIPKALAPHSTTPPAPPGAPCLRAVATRAARGGASSGGLLESGTLAAPGRAVQAVSRKPPNYKVLLHNDDVNRCAPAAARARSRTARPSGVGRPPSALAPAPLRKPLAARCARPPAPKRHAQRPDGHPPRALLPQA